MTKLRIKGKKRFVFLTILILITLLTIWLIVFLNGDKKNGKKNSTTKKTTNKLAAWSSPKGLASKLKIYKSDVKNTLLTVKEGDYNQLVENEEYQLISNYDCTTSSCKSYGASTEMGYLIIKDGGYFVYNYEKNLAKKIAIPDAEYNTMEFLTYEGKVYGLAVSNINDLYAFYSMDLGKFTTDFNYTNIFNFDIACLIKGYFIAAASESGNLEEAYYYLVDYQTGAIKRKSSSHLGSFGNGKHVYYYENHSFDNGYYAQLYNDDFNLLLDGKRYDMFAVSKAGNLVIKNDDNTFSVYNAKGTLIKTSKKYKQVMMVLNDYVMVTDNDDYLKLIDYDSNVIAKFTKMKDDYLFDNMTSGVYVSNNKKFIYADVRNLNSGEVRRYYYDLQTRDSGVLEAEKS